MLLQITVSDTYMNMFGNIGHSEWTYAS